jgi:hypothetical protein
MRAGVNALIAVCAAAAILSASQNAVAAGDTDANVQEGESRWVPSFAVTSGVVIQRQSGAFDSALFDGDGADPTAPLPLRRPLDGSDRVLTPFVGGTLELMTPAAPIPTRPRLFVSGEVIPMFGSQRQISLEGEPSRIRGAELDTVLAVDENDVRFQEPQRGPRRFGFGESEASGQGARTSATMGDLAWGARVGVAFPFELAGRQLRIKPSFGWIRYDVEAHGAMVDPSCQPSTQCTNTYFPDGTLINPGFLRESILTGNGERTFDGYGPGIDVEMDTGRVGPLGVALFLGVHGYYIFGEREISFSASETFTDQLSGGAVDVHTASWRARVDPWLYRGSLGFRLQWLGGAR